MLARDTHNIVLRFSQFRHIDDLFIPVWYKALSIAARDYREQEFTFEYVHSLDVSLCVVLN